MREDDPAYITPAEIARIMGVSRATVYGRVLVPGSGLPVHRLGRRRVVPLPFHLPDLGPQTVGAYPDDHRQVVIGNVFFFHRPRATGNRRHQCPQTRIPGGKAPLAVLTLDGLVDRRGADQIPDPYHLRKETAFSQFTAGPAHGLRGGKVLPLLIGNRFPYRPMLGYLIRADAGNHT